jgi:hypothetical protein
MLCVEVITKAFSVVQLFFHSSERNKISSLYTLAHSNPRFDMRMTSPRQHEVLVGSCLCHIWLGLILNPKQMRKHLTGN